MREQEGATNPNSPRRPLPMIAHPDAADKAVPLTEALDDRGHDLLCRDGLLGVKRGEACVGNDRPKYRAGITMARTRLSPDDLRTIRQLAAGWAGGRGDALGGVWGGGDWGVRVSAADIVRMALWSAASLV